MSSARRHRSPSQMAELKERLWTDEEMQACETIMDEARKALSNGTDEQLLHWAAARLTPELRIALNRASTDEIVRYQARSLGTRPRRYH